jgi:hypothetical protein
MTASTNPSSQSFVSTPIVPAPILNVDTKRGWPTGAHPAAELFPLMKDTDRGLLVDDIVEHGLREPILVYQGLILDGRNRLRACEIAGVEPRFVEWDGVGSPLAIVLSRNLHRRHLNEGQRAIIAARAKGMFEDEAAERERAHQFRQPQQSPATEGGETETLRETTAIANLHEPGRTVNEQAAELLNVSPRSVATASRVLKSADEQVIAAVESGDVAVSDAASVANRPKDQQRQALQAKRQGRARTLRQAAEELGDNPTSSEVTEANGAPTRRQRRAEATRFVRQLDKLLLRLDALTAAFGPSDHTQHMRDCLHRLVDAFRDFARHFLRAEK